MGKKNELDFIKCACRFTENCTIDEANSKRQETKNLLKQLREKDKTIDMNLFKSSENINIDTVLGYKKDGKRYNFLDNY